MSLTHLVCYSQRNPSEILDIKDLIETCKRNNARLNLSGALHYNGDHVLQVLDGGRVEVSTLVDGIASRHR